MKRIHHIIKKAATLALPLCLLTACDYLDVIPPAQADFDDTMKDESYTLDFLYTAYSYLPRCQAFYDCVEQSADEIAQPPQWNSVPQQVAWGTIAATSSVSADAGIWTSSYNYLGYVHRFEQLLDQLNPTGVTEADKDKWRAEAKFLDAYYHFRVLAAFGPCPIITSLVDPNITNTQIPGRSHFDYCVNYIVGLLDEAAAGLPVTRETEELGRATSVIAKCLKARVLLYAASPLWNGSFFDKTWKNTNYETEGYGKELVSHEYDASKWQRALTACQEALTAAEAAGYKLFDIETANKKAERDGIGLPFVPGREADTEENRLFKERVRMFQYLSTATEDDGNGEIIWGVRLNQEGNNSGNAVFCRLPERVQRRSNGSWQGGWAANAPTLYTVQHFYTEDGKLPANDKDFYPESEWYTRFYEGTSSPALTNNALDKEDVKNDIIKFNVKREARYYAWIAFDGSQYAQKIDNGNALWMNFKNSNTNGYRSGLRNCVGTGFLSKKFIDPNIKYTSSGNRSWTATRRPFIRMAELYLNLAECYAALGDNANALKNLNIIRERAGLPDLQTSDITSSMSLDEWIHTERYIELYEEGHRYYDVRRWCIAPDVLKAGSRKSLDAYRVNPTFEEFNTPVQMSQSFKWYNRMYLLPIWSSELYSDPQMVQAPGY